MPQWQGRFSKGFLERRGEVVLEIGDDRFTKIDLAHMGCVNFKAASILNDVVRQFKPKNVHDLFRKMSVDELGGIGGVGEATVCVWCIIMDNRGLDVDAWFGVYTKVPTMLRACKLIRMPHQHPKVTYFPKTA